MCGFDPAPYEVLIRPGPRLGEAAALLADCLVRLGAGQSAARAGASAASPTP
ncbi:MAG: hypothetical protein ACOVOT_07230 [Rubrivivax sp.]